MSTLPQPRLTPEEYLELERKAEFKSEYYNGEMFAMSGGSRVHDWIAGQLGMLVKQDLRKSKCTMHTANMRFFVQAPRLYTYPDLSVVCGEAEFLDSHVDTLLNPVLLFEILSPSTRPTIPDGKLKCIAPSRLSRNSS